MAWRALLAGGALAQNDEPERDAPERDADGDIVFLHALDKQPIDFSWRPDQEITPAVEQFHKTAENAYSGDPVAIKEGRRLYARLCQACHLAAGTDRIGRASPTAKGPARAPAPIAAASKSSTPAAPAPCSPSASASMIGSTKVPAAKFRRSASFGITCNEFLEKLRSHPSKASAGYYYKTHVDYFRKMASSLHNVAGSMKKRGAAVLVVQDSYYKEIHNDLPAIITEMASFHGLNLMRRKDFRISRTLAGFNRQAKKYREGSEATEAVLCFSKASI